MKRAIRAVVSGAVQNVGFREAVTARARELGAMGWVRNQQDGTVLVHAEGAAEALAKLEEFLGNGPQAARVAALEVEAVKVEGHEQFAIRGVSAGRFAVTEQAIGSDGARRFALRLEVDGATRSWALPKAPSLDPAVKRFALELGEDDPSADRSADDEASVWDSGAYEQGGRVAWPEALERGHAVFALHGEKLRGGFALQRTRPGSKAQWLLIKRRDDQAEPAPASGAT
jgi:DNA ligase D-like protein (predicted 3'-phosphoesterase)